MDSLNKDADCQFLEDHMIMAPATLYQPWIAVVADLGNKNEEIKAVPDTETFQKGEAIVIGGQSRWNHASNARPVANGLWYDTADTAEKKD
jgi:hypothetical protein